MSYKGWYSYNNNKSDFEFAIQSSSSDKITGKGQDEGGQFSIELKIQKSLFCTMRKIYHGAHSVNLLYRLILTDYLLKHCLDKKKDITIL